MWFHGSTLHCVQLTAQVNGFGVIFLGSVAPPVLPPLETLSGLIHHVIISGRRQDHVGAVYPDACTDHNPAQHLRLKNCRNCMMPLSHCGPKSLRKRTNKLLMYPQRIQPWCKIGSCRVYCIIWQIYLEVNSYFCGEIRMSQIYKHLFEGALHFEDISQRLWINLKVRIYFRI